MADIPVIDELGGYVSTRRAAEIMAYTVDAIRKLVFRGQVESVRWEDHSLMINKVSLEYYRDHRQPSGRPKKKTETT